MAIYSGNSDYLAIDGVDLSAFWREVSITQTVGSRDVTSGGVTTRQRIPTVFDYTLEFTIMYDDVQRPVLIPLVAAGLHVVEYGIEGATVGKPRHMQTFLFTDSGLEGYSDKSEARAFSISANSADVPVFNMYNGDTF